MPKKLHLRPDLSFIKEVPWQKKEALIMADVLDPKDGQLIPYAPRNILKTLFTTADLSKDIKSQLVFSLSFYKHPSKEEKEDKKKSSFRD